MGDCVFCGIARKQVPATVLYEDRDVMAFRDLRPQAPIHLLVIPKQHLASLAEAGPAHRDLLGNLLLIGSRLAREQGLTENGFRVVLNTGRNGGQSVSHLHLHVLGGRAMGWPPG